MKKIFLGITYGVFLMALFFSSANARTWINNDGKAIEADFVRVEGDKVVIKMRGKEYKVPINSLSAADQEYIKEQTASTSSSSSTPSSGGSSSSLELVGTGVEVEPGGRVYFEAPMDEKLAKNAKKDVSRHDGMAKVALCVPENFDPNGDYKILVINDTSSSEYPSSIHHMMFFWNEGIERNYVVIAADGTEKIKKDGTEWRWALLKAGLEKIHESWPKSKEWPIVCAGWSGGAKWSGHTAARLSKDGYTIAGILMVGCNQAAPVVGIDMYKPSKSKFKKTPLYFSTGDDDHLVSMSKLKSVIKQCENAGFKTIKSEIFSGGHDLHSPHVENGLDWFNEQWKK